MTTPTRTEGDRFLDNCGRTWIVDEHGGLTHEAPGGTLRRTWHSLDACAGPLQPVTDKPQPGDEYMDREGDIWTADERGDLYYLDSPTKYPFAEVDDDLGPLTKIDRDEDKPKLHKLVNEPFRPLPLFTDAQRDAIGAAVDRVFPPLDDDDPVNHPQHYKSGGMEAIDVIDAFFLHDAHLANVFKYIARAGKKGDATECLMKAAWYLDRAIERRHTEAA